MINNRHTDGLLGLPGFRPGELRYRCTYISLVV